jgi:hypothetical protein
MGRDILDYSWYGCAVLKCCIQVKAEQTWMEVMEKCFDGMWLTLSHSSQVEQKHPMTPFFIPIAFHKDSIQSSELGCPTYAYKEIRMQCLFGLHLVYKLNWFNLQSLRLSNCLHEEQTMSNGNPTIVYATPKSDMCNVYSFINKPNILLGWSEDCYKISVALPYFSALYMCSVLLVKSEKSQFVVENC